MTYPIPAPNGHKHKDSCAFLVEMLWDGPNPEWMQDNNGTDPRESLSAPLLNLQKCSIIIVS